MNLFRKVVDFLARDCTIHLINLFTMLLPNAYVTTLIRGKLIGLCIGGCGRHFRVASGVIINKPSQMVVGDNVYIAHNAWINAVGGLTIGSNSTIGPMAVIATSRHAFINREVTNVAIFRPIIIGSGVWIASHAVITDGVRIDDGALVASGAVVTHDVRQNVMVGGVPAIEIKPMI